MIYADYNGSTPICNEVIEYLKNRITEGVYSNPNASHSMGKKIMFNLEKCRRSMAKHLGCKSSQIIFNSGASEGISHIFYSLLNCGPKNNKNIIITSGIEHAAVVRACEHYAKNSYVVLKVNTNTNGVVDLEHFQNLVQDQKGKVALVSIMAANNETGVVQPFKEIGKICQENEIPFFSDTTQYIGKTEFNFSESFMDFAVTSSHKIGGLIGSGVSIAKNPKLLKSHTFGGGQEFGYRGGTQNYIGIECMSVAMDTFQKNLSSLANLRALRDDFEKKLKDKFPKIIIIGEDAPRLASTSLISLPGISGQAVQAELEAQDVYVTTSSACSDSEADTSKVLKSMNITDEVGRGVVRISLCTNANEDLYSRVEKAVTHAYEKIGKK